MSSDLPRWFMILVVVAAVVGLVIWARGPEHHRGQDVGAMHSRSASVDRGA